MKVSFRLHLQTNIQSCRKLHYLFDLQMFRLLFPQSSRVDHRYLRSEILYIFCTAGKSCQTRLPEFIRQEKPVGNKLVQCLLLVIQITAAYPQTRQVQLPGYPYPYWRLPGIKYITMGIIYRLAYWNNL